MSYAFVNLTMNWPEIRDPVGIRPVWLLTLHVVEEKSMIIRQQQTGHSPQTAAHLKPLFWNSRRLMHQAKCGYVRVHIKATGWLVNRAMDVCSRQKCTVLYRKKI